MFLFHGDHVHPPLQVELFAFASFVQFVFLGVRLDNAVTWNWAVILPLIIIIYIIN